MRFSKFLSVVLSLVMISCVFFACAPSGGDIDTTVADTQGQDTPAETLPEKEEPTVPPAEETSDEEITDETPPPEPDPATRPAQEVKVLSMNLDANESTASSRAKLMAPLLMSFDADSIGVQECRGSWISLLKRHFLTEGYARVGVDAGGSADATGIYFATYILYKEDKFNLIDSGTFWLSTTPDVPSIYGPTVDTNRTCTWALLEDKETGFRYVHMNCHLDWMDMEVNKIQVKMIREQIERFEAMGYPVFAGGDYNCDEGTDSYFAMLDSEVVADSKKVAERANDIATYPSYGNYDVYDPSERPIDYFFVTKEHMTVKEYRVVDEKPEGEYISDHFPVFVHALVNEMPIMDEADNLPAFAEGDALTAESVNAGIHIVFKQAVSKVGVMASKYRIEIIKDGKTCIEQVRTSGVLNLEAPESIDLTINGLTESGNYTVKVTPINLFGAEGTPLEREVAFTYEVIAKDMPAADIVDIRVEGDEPIDVSPNAYAVQKKGNTDIVETEFGKGMDFNKHSNYMVREIKNHYKTMAEGFTMEVYFTTGDDVNTFQSLVSNMHAGGYGADWEDGRIYFRVRIGSAYVGPSAAVEENTTYHMVGVFDGSFVRLYLNGVLMGETAVSGPMVHPTDSGAEYLCIGADSDATGAGEYPIDATVYLVRMYSEIANESQALYLYEKVAQ